MLNELSRNVRRFPVTTGVIIFSSLIGIAQLGTAYFYGMNVHNRIFVLTPQEPLYIAPWFLSIFSHGGVLHLVINMFILSMFGIIVEDSFSPKKTVLFFVSAGLISSLAQVLAVFFFNPSAISTGIVGSSGFISGCVGYAAVKMPNVKILLFFIIPMKMYKGVGLFILLSVVVLVKFGIGAFGFAHTAHLSGLLFGIFIGALTKIAFDDMKSASKLS